MLAPTFRLRVALLLTLAGCGGGGARTLFDSGSVGDAGRRDVVVAHPLDATDSSAARSSDAGDAGAPQDAGQPHEAGRSHDAGQPHDSSHSGDAQQARDADESHDGSLSSDAAHLGDAAHDAGRSRDGGVPDAGSGTDGRREDDGATPLTWDFPTGTLQCNVAGNSVGGGGSLSISLSGGVVSAHIERADYAGTVRFQVGTARTARAVPGQSYQAAILVDGGLVMETVPLRGGALTLVDGQLVMGLYGDGAAGPNVVWFQCEVPYAPCDPSPPAPAADLPSGTYDLCSNSWGGGQVSSLSLTRTGAGLALGYRPASQTPFPSGDLTVVADGTAVSRTDPPRSCGSGPDVVLAVDGDVLFVAYGTDWASGVVVDLACVASGSTLALPPPPAADATGVTTRVPAATQAGRSVAACSACTGEEFCVTLTGYDLGYSSCTMSTATPGSTTGTGSGTTATTATTECRGSAYLSPYDTYSCWPQLPACGATPDCACGEGVVDLVCGLAGSCEDVSGGLACTEYVAG